MHRRDVHVGPAGEMERCRCGQLRVEAVRPLRVEVDRVGEHQRGLDREIARLEQIRDLAVRVVAEPVVDGRGGRVRVHEVDRRERRLVRTAPACRSTGRAPTARVCNQAWSTSCRVTPLRRPRGERARQPSDRVVQRRARQRHVERGDDLLLRRTARARGDHAEHRRDARRRDRDTGRARRRELAVERHTRTAPRPARRHGSAPASGAGCECAEPTSSTPGVPEVDGGFDPACPGDPDDPQPAARTVATNITLTYRSRFLMTSTTLGRRGWFPAQRPPGQDPGSSRNATVLSTRGSPGSPSTRSPITLRWICSVPPPMRLLHCIRNCCCQ